MNVEKLTWYAARSGGIVAWCLLALGIILGLVLSSRLLGRRVSPAWTLSVHRYLGGLSVVFTAVHVAAIMLDDFVDFGLRAVLIPWASTWRPGAVAWGIVAMYLMVAIEITSFAMRRLPKRLWRAVHWSSAPLFVAATIHGYQAGTDVGRAFVVATVGVIAVLVALTAVRVLRARGADSKSGARPDPRELLDRAKGRPQMRATAPDHILDGLTLATRPIAPAPPASAAAPMSPAAPTAPPGPSRRTPEPVVAGAAARTVAPERPTTLDDALPPVPDAPPIGDLAAGAGEDEAGAAFFDALAGIAATPAPRPTVSTAAPPVAPQPPSPPKRRVTPAAEATPSPPKPAQTTSTAAMPPRPAWGETGEGGPDAPDGDRRLGPAPGVWKRSASAPQADER